jgi:methylmalonic aciduria homocystinuria type C protein
MHDAIACGSWHRADVLTEAGFDIAHAFDTARLADEPTLAEIVDPARRFGILIGNTRALWPRFLAAREADPVLAASADPIEHYTEDVIGRAFAGDRIWFVHRRYGGAFLPFQRLAVLTGLGALAPTQLVIHPTFGPWFALRAVIVRAGDPPPPISAPAPCLCDGSCEAALARATATSGPEAWRAWLAVRDACSVGREHRYDDDQIRYHYTKNRGLLGRRT